MPSASEVIKKPLARDKSKVKRGFTGEVIRDGGDRGAGLIKHFSVITEGEALGHEMWCDGEFVQQVTDAINAAGDAGLKCRFTHPGLSADGMGKFLGNLKNASKEGNQAFCDLHFSTNAHNTPDGDLAEYVMNLAEEDPDKFGSSIVFLHDRKAEEMFYVEHKSEDSGEFQSPDSANSKNYYHVRLKQLFGADMVDDPAANPGGLFHRGQEIAQEATSLMEFVLADDGAAAPVLAQFDVDPGRFKSFFDRFLEEHGLKVVSTEKEPEAMTKETTAPAEKQTETPATVYTKSDFTAELQKYQERFGAENGAKWFAEGKSMEESLAAQVELLEKALLGKDETIKELQEKLASIDTGETEPFNSTPGEGKGKSLKDCFKIPGK
ncbi:hypothetical protein [Paremcibacter congregatus]|uniref:hypothetical protein n=1 Tax=Paremcibacter congregatus TaxID=2043170 RepID=UPI003A8D4D77